MKFYIYTLGCKVNTYESSVIKDKLIDAGYTEGTKDDADIFVVNTCTVTNTSDNKSLKMVRHIKKNNPESICVVVGCMTQVNSKYLDDLDVSIILGNKGKSDIVKYIEEYKKNRKQIKIMDPNVNTKFEDEQEEKAIISYKELVDNVRNGKIQAIDDETNKPVDTFQLSNVETKTIDREESVTPEMLKDAIENISANSVKEEIEKFKSSAYISPIYGIMKDNMSYPTIKKKEVTLDAISNTRDYTELTEEIKRQEEFLKALKEFRDSL